MAAARRLSKAGVIPPLWMKPASESDKVFYAGAAPRWQMMPVMTAPLEPERETISSAAGAAAVIAPLLAGAYRERIVLLHLDISRTLIRISEYEGEASHAELPLRRMFEEALTVGSHGLLVAHNHPSGDPEPSEADLQATRELAATAQSLGILLYDHLIFGADEWRSLRQMGLL
jgi:DNA repair protein RadC